jgi:hypothetical protein
MPINYAEYHPKWSLISRLIRYHRAGNCCESCHVPNGALIHRPHRDKSKWEIFPHWLIDSKSKVSRVTLTVAHLDHDKHNNRFTNLKALCNRCHLVHDSKQHQWSRKYGRKTKYLNGKLF